MSEAKTLRRFSSSGEYSATEEAIFDAAANEINLLRKALGNAHKVFAAEIEALHRLIPRKKER